jgi:hypothetical protein
MHAFIEKGADVAGNGHFGFHVVAGQRDISVDDYQIICYQLLKELTGDGSKRYLR